MELIFDQVWPRLIASWKNGPRFVAVAYYSNDENLAFSDGDILVVDASEEAISRLLNLGRG